jgi:hypothetical protein
MIVSHNFASHLEFDCTGRCVHVVSPHATISSNVYLPLCCCNDVIRAVDRCLFFSLPCYVYFPLWYGHSCNDFHKPIEMSLLKDVSMGAESGIWSRYPTLSSAFWSA